MSAMGSDCLQVTAEVRSPHRWSPLVETPPIAECELCAIVPVRNEAENLESTLAALSHQTDLQGQSIDPTRYEIVLLANNCTDDSAAIAKHFAKTHPDLNLHVVEKTLPPQEAYIGRVRQILMDEAYHRLMSIGRTQGVIASTDGDTRVAPTWIAATLHEIALGADAVGGRIITDRVQRAQLDPYTRACHLHEVGYRYLIAELESYLDGDPDDFPRHFQHYGASLAVTAQMYKQAGGMPAVRTPEDVAFYRALVRVNARFRHSPLVRVITSARQTGRTNIGLANQLNQWSAMGSQNQPFLVESAAEIETCLQARHKLRVLWRCILNDYQISYGEITACANVLGVGYEWLLQELQLYHTFGLLWERVEQRQQEEGIWCRRWSKVRISVAIADLRLLIDSLRRQQKLKSVVGCIHPVAYQKSGSVIHPTKVVSTAH